MSVPLAAWCRLVPFDLTQSLPQTHLLPRLKCYRHTQKHTCTLNQQANQQANQHLARRIRPTSTCAVLNSGKNKNMTNKGAAQTGPGRLRKQREDYCENVCKRDGRKS